MAELLLWKAFRPDGRTAATLMPAAFGLAGVNLHTYTGWGNVTHWNAFVANLEMMGSGTFYDPRLNDAARFPVATRARLFDVRKSPDLVTSKLAALHYYQLSIPAPNPPPGSFDAALAERGRETFNHPRAVRPMPRATALHGAGLAHAHSRRDWHLRLPGQPFARRQVQDDAAQGAVHAAEGWVLSRLAGSRRSRRWWTTTTACSVCG